MWDASSLYQPVRAAGETDSGACAEYDAILMRVAHAMAQLDDIDAIFQLVNSTLVETLACDRSSTFLMRDDHSLRLGGQSGRGGGPRDVYESDAFRRAAEPMVKWLCRERRSLVVSGPPFPPMLSARLAAELNLRSLMVVPILHAERVAGAITASRTDLPVPFTPAEVEFAEGLASHAAVALRRASLREENARHVEALRQSEQRYRALVERA
jgi:GAF domain-containing protein